MKGVRKLFGSKRAGRRGENEQPVEMEYNPGVHSVLSSDSRTPKKANALMVAAIDLGTTYSGWGYSFRDDFERDPANVFARSWNDGGHLVSVKAPTCVLLEKEGAAVKLKSFGYDAETDYSELVSAETTSGYFFFFERFKMMLFGDKSMPRDRMLEDANGNHLRALTVFKLAIQYLKDDLLETSRKGIADMQIYPSDIHWVITVPAIWSDAAKHFMREAAKLAGIASDMLTIALEPEAASLYCRQVPLERSERGTRASLKTLKPGTKYMVVDAGGGTVDVAVHEVMEDDKLREFYKANGGAWGGTKVDDAFRRLLFQLFGEPLMNRIRDEAREDFINLFRSFELKKRTLKPSKYIHIRLPLELWSEFNSLTDKELTDVISESGFAGKISLKHGKLVLCADIVAGFFEESVVSIVDHIQCIMQDPAVKDISCILLVGGFSEATILQDRIKATFPKMKIIIPPSPGFAVLKGAVIFGHSPSTVAERVCRFTYGIAVKMPFQEGVHPKAKKIFNGGESLCVDVFCIHVQAGQAVKFGEAQEEKEYRNVFGELSMGLYATPDPNPRFITDSGCRKIGTIRVPGNENYERIKVKMTFGGTEIEIDAMSVQTGEQVKATIDFLE